MVYNYPNPKHTPYNNAKTVIIVTQCDKNDAKLMCACPVSAAVTGISKGDRVGLDFQRRIVGIAHNSTHSRRFPTYDAMTDDGKYHLCVLLSRALHGPQIYN